MLIKDELGRLRHTKDIKGGNAVECYTCGVEYRKFNTPLIKQKDTNNYFCKEHAMKFNVVSKRGETNND